MKFYIYFFRPSKEIFLVLLQITNYVFSPQFKLFWYKISVHWQLKLLNFLMDYVFISFIRAFLHVEQKKQGWFYSREYIFFVNNISEGTAFFLQVKLKRYSLKWRIACHTGVDKIRNMEHFGTYRNILEHEKIKKFSRKNK